MWYIHLGCVIIIIIQLSTTISEGSSPSQFAPGPTPYHDWDYLMFSQRWPITTCAEWEETNKNNTCNLPQDRTMWTIHGIWPTKFGTDGPWFCPSAVHFDPDQLEPLMNDLNTNWVNIEANTKPNSFWAHEWKKHGTCSITLPQLNSVYNFFKRGLELHKQYDLSAMLATSKIIPQQSGYAIDDIYNAIQNVIKTKPEIQCVVDHNSKESLISEIRICFNKSFALIDCDSSNPDHFKGLNDILSNCNLKKPVMYFKDLPPSLQNSLGERNTEEELQRYYEERNYLRGVYYFFKFLIWYTL